MILTGDSYTDLDGMNVGAKTVGNMESRCFLSGRYGLVVCDCISGNVLFKSTEDTCLKILMKQKRNIFSRIIYKLGITP